MDYAWYSHFMDAKIHKFLIVRNFRNEIFVQLKISPNIPLHYPFSLAHLALQEAGTGNGTDSGVEGEGVKCR